MTAGRVDFDDLPPDLQKTLRASMPEFKRTRQTSFTKDDVRTYALRAMAPLAALTPGERKRVLMHALQVNKV